MEFKIRNGEIDVAIVAGPRMQAWPTFGVRMLTRWCSDAGMAVAWYGGDDLKVQGVLANEGSGGVVVAEDLQGRIHRIHAKAVVKINPILSIPPPFAGWYSPGLIPEGTAVKLMNQGSLNWGPATVILGSGNRALRLGAELIERALVSQVFCVESAFPRVVGWEVARRRFEMLGGTVLFAKPEELVTKSAFTWDLKLNGVAGAQTIEVARVISCGPFAPDAGFREYPPGSFLVEWENAEHQRAIEDIESTLVDEARSLVLASRLIRGLLESVPQSVKQALDRALWVSKQRLRELEFDDRKTFEFEYQGKWLSERSRTQLMAFPGTPQKLELERPNRMVAAIDCIEPIACRICERDCPVQAIQIDRTPTGTTQKFLLEDQCTGCGRCLQVCPSSIPVMIDGDSKESFSTLVLPHRGKGGAGSRFSAGERIQLLNRRGEILVGSRVLDLFIDGEVPLYRVEVPTHLFWEARGMARLGAAPEVEDSKDFYQEKGTRVDVQIQGNSRRVREGQLISVALFEIGMSRPNDILMCEDGACGLCQIEVDGVRKFACQTHIRQGMTIRFTRDHETSTQICPCKELSTEQVQERCKTTQADTVETFFSMTELTQGRCHGLICRSASLALAQDEGIEVEGYADWAFPWRDWTLRN